MFSSEVSNLIAYRRCYFEVLRNFCRVSEFFVIRETWKIGFFRERRVFNASPEFFPDCRVVRLFFFAPPCCCFQNYVLFFHETTSRRHKGWTRLENWIFDHKLFLWLGRGWTISLANLYQSENCFSGGAFKVPNIAENKYTKSWNITNSKSAFKHDCPYTRDSPWVIIFDLNSGETQKRHEVRVSSPTRSSSQIKWF